MPLGVIVHGAFCGASVINGKDGAEKQVLLVSVGMDAYRIYMRDLLKTAYQIGTELYIQCRVYNGKNSVGFADGVICVES